MEHHSVWGFPKINLFQAIYYVACEYNEFHILQGSPHDFVGVRALIHVSFWAYFEMLTPKVHNKINYRSKCIVALHIYKKIIRHSPILWA